MNSNCFLVPIVLQLVKIHLLTVSVILNQIAQPHRQTDLQ